MADDILDRFTDPITKRKRNARKEAQRESKRRKVFLDGKWFACDLFNEPPTPTKLQQWHQAWTRPTTMPIVPLMGSEYQQEDEEWLQKQLGINAKPSSDDPFAYITYFATVVNHCRNWLHHKLTELGWTRNETGYDPVEVSYSVPEVLHATWQAYHMAAKQTRWLL